MKIKRFNLGRLFYNNKVVMLFSVIIAFIFWIILPTILFSIAENQMSESEYMGEKHIVKYIGNYVDKNFWEILEEEFIRILKDKEIRNKMSANMKKVIDGKGSIRIAKCIESLM